MDRHEAIPLIYAAREILDIKNTGILNARFIGADGRLHPFGKQLGTDTGRQVTRWPNVLGVSRLMRPLVIPELGFGIGEVDLSQIEVFIVAAEYNDETLIQICNAGDVYVGMVKRFHRDIPDADMRLTDKEFKEKHGEKRDRMKILTLGIIYGSTPYSIAPLLKISVSDAERVLADFMAMFPALQRRRLEVAAFGAIRGSVATVTGLRRYRGKVGVASNWERNWMTNHPIQGSAAVVFKMAGNRLDRLLQEFGVKLIIAFHDAYVFEAPLEHMDRVAQLIKEEMIRAVQEIYPTLRPRADPNIKRPECWNKDGNADSIKQWLAKPLGPVIEILAVKGRTLEKPGNAPSQAMPRNANAGEVDGMNL